MNETIRQNYLNSRHPTAFSAPGNIKRHNNTFGRNEILNTLNSIDSYTLHREYHKPRLRNPYYVYEKRQQVQMDLIDISSLKKYNNNITFLLVAIDVFTKFGWIKPLKQKTAVETLRGIQSIFHDMGDLPKSILFDRGKEFVNRQVTNFLIGANIKIIHPNSELKAAVAERFNRTIQDKIYKYLTENETYKYIDELSNLLHSYNNRPHRTLQYITPSDAELNENKNKVLNAHNVKYTKINEKRKVPKYKIGQKVRIKSLQQHFQRGYHERFLREHFEIIGINVRMPIPMYIIKSLNTNDVIKGAFYEEELQPVSGDVFKVEKVIKKRTLRNGEEELFVKWQGYDNQHNSWIKATDVVRNYR